MILFRPLSNPFWILADILQILVVLILVDFVVSWAIVLGIGGVSPHRPWVRALRKITDPILRPFRLLIPPYKLRGIDVSPALAIIVINLVIGFLDKAGAHLAAGG